MPEYVTLAELKAQIVAGSTTPTYTASEDSNLQLAIQSASEWLDTHFDTTFIASTETRYYMAEYGNLLEVDDFLSVTTLKTDDDGDGTYETTWTTSDYWLIPRNARVKTNKTPYREIWIKDNGSYSFPVGVQYGVELASVYGYSATPPLALKQACALLSHRLWMRGKTPLGIAVTPALGVMTVIAKVSQDSDIQSLLGSIDRRGF